MFWKDYDPYFQDQSTPRVLSRCKSNRSFFLLLSSNVKCIENVAAGQKLPGAGSGFAPAWDIVIVEAAGAADSAPPAAGIKISETQAAQAGQVDPGGGLTRRQRPPSRTRPDIGPEASRGRAAAPCRRCRRGRLGTRGKGAPCKNTDLVQFE